MFRPNLTQCCKRGKDQSTSSRESSEYTMYILHFVICVVRDTNTMYWQFYILLMVQCFAFGRQIYLVANVPCIFCLVSIYSYIEDQHINTRVDTAVMYFMLDFDGKRHFRVLYRKHTYKKTLKYEHLIKINNDFVTDSHIHYFHFLFSYDRYDHRRVLLDKKKSIARDLLGADCSE
jgi:hypothetical protein